MLQLKVSTDDDSESEAFRTVEVSLQQLTFEHFPECQMLTIRDNSHFERI